MDIVKPLKIESTSDGGGQIDFGPTEVNKLEDFLAALGISFEGLTTAYITKSGNDIVFRDHTITTPVSLDALANKIKGKLVDLAALSNGLVLTWDAVNEKFIMAVPSSQMASKMPNIQFGKDGSVGIGSYLEIGNTASNKSGLPLQGTHNLTGMSATIANTVANTTRIQLQRRTGVNTWTDIANAYVDVVAGQYSGFRTGINVSLGPDYILASYNKSGSSVADPTLICSTEPVN